MIDPGVFHDAPIARLFSEGDTVHIEVEEFALSSVEMCPPSRISIRHCREVLRDGVPVPAMTAESEDGEIYGIDWDAGGITLSVIWSRYEPHAEWSVTYRLVRARLDIAPL
ncbi:hypothetical protein [Inquilinus limosus]|uniref:Uncharacterized protein n=1 Tax=Inquilinus limosus MP06 TaxID=1398085 RepID=A0A0A0D596_9PROT|nr:hypothetical protein [Inquilinus limosus]KGM32998.1 hypothetical protein P409_18230 [Inquilinus limosus MP06]